MEIFEHKGHTYYISIEPAIHEQTKETVYISYISKDIKPKGLLLGIPIRKDLKEITIFGDPYTALLNTKILIQESNK